MDYKDIIIIGLVFIILIGMFIYNGGMEGFEDISPSEKINSFVNKFLPRRGDIGEFEEESGYRRDPRFFGGYADVQGLGVKNDFCRMIEPAGSEDPLESFFACALAGTENLSGTEFRTETAGEGFRRSRDDYMHDISKSGREDYCRILKSEDGTFQRLCRRAMDRRFGRKDVIDAQPPANIKTLLDFYDGIMMWLRLRDDLIDYAGNLLVSTAGDIKIDETPALTFTEGLRFNGADQFLRIGDNQSLEFSDNISMRSMRAFSCWVYFDEFTNNAHIFDFGSGPGMNNVFLGIVGRGNPTISTDVLRPVACQDTVPEPPSGAQEAPEMSPQKLMKTTAANTNDFTCPGPEMVGRRMAPLIPKAAPPKGPPVTADLIYEVWDSQQRKMRIRIPNAVRLKTWTHITITAANNDAFRPDFDIYINGCFVFKFPNGFLPQTSFMTHNYLGKSNWANATSQYDNRDELFKGSLFDFRAYNKPMDMRKIQETVKWGSKLLNIKVPKSLEENLKAMESQDKIVAVNQFGTESPLLKDSGILIENPPF